MLRFNSCLNFGKIYIIIGFKSRDLVVLTSEITSRPCGILSCKHWRKRRKSKSPKTFVCANHIQHARKQPPVSDVENFVSDNNRRQGFAECCAQARRDCITGVTIGSLIRPW